MVDALGEERDLHLGRAGVGVVETVLRDDLGLGLVDISDMFGGDSGLGRVGLGPGPSGRWVQRAPLAHPGARAPDRRGGLISDRREPYQSGPGRPSISGVAGRQQAPAVPGRAVQVLGVVVALAGRELRGPGRRARRARPRSRRRRRRGPARRRSSALRTAVPSRPFISVSMIAGRVSGSFSSQECWPCGRPPGRPRARRAAPSAVARGTARSRSPWMANSGTRARPSVSSIHLGARGCAGSTRPGRAGATGRRTWPGDGRGRRGCPSLRAWRGSRNHGHGGERVDHAG